MIVLAPLHCSYLSLFTQSLTHPPPTSVTILTHHTQVLYSPLPTSWLYIPIPSAHPCSDCTYPPQGPVLQRLNTPLPTQWPYSPLPRAQPSSGCCRWPCCWRCWRCRSRWGWRRGHGCRRVHWSVWRWRHTRWWSPFVPRDRRAPCRRRSASLFPNHTWSNTVTIETNQWNRKNKIFHYLRPVGKCFGGSRYPARLHHPWIYAIRYFGLLYSATSA